MKVFLGGTCNRSNWRNIIIPLLEIDYFNPVVEAWTPEFQAEELVQRETCDVVLYCITPKMTGAYSIAEVVDDSNKRPMKTILVVLSIDEGFVFGPGQTKSLQAVAELVQRNGGRVFHSLVDAAEAINSVKEFSVPDYSFDDNWHDLWERDYFGDKD